MTMPGRKYSSSSSSYRYGFNGKEKDNSTGEGNLDFGARIYDSRLGRWLGVDKFADKYPNVSPYAFCINSPLQFTDANGNWLVDKNGNIIYTLGQITYERSNDGKMYEVRLFYFYTNDGQAVEAGRYRFNTEMSNVNWDEVNKWPISMKDDNLKVDMSEGCAENSSCHGNTLKLHGTDNFDLYIPGRDFTKNSDNVSKIFKNQAEFTPINAEDVKPGDVAIFEDGKGNIQHSATVTKVKKNGSVKLTSKDDRNPVKTNQSIKKVMKNKEYAKFAGYYRHKGNVSTGTSSNSVYPGLMETEEMEKVLKDVKKDKTPEAKNTTNTEKSGG